MTMGLVIRLFLIGLGIFLIIQDILNVAYRKMSEKFAISWALLSVFLIVGGCVINPIKIQEFLDWPFFILMLLSIVIVVEGALRLTQHISDLSLKNAELVMQVSLLNSENVKIKEILRKTKDGSSL